MKNVKVFLPCYNEGENIFALIVAWMKEKKQLRNSGYKLHIFAIDDCSVDGTQTEIIKSTKEYADVFLIAHETNKGLNGGLNTAISHFFATGSQDDIMVVMDGDNTHNPSYIHEMLNKMNSGVDCVIASRYAGNASVIGVAKHREFLSDMAKIYYRMVLKIPNVTDYTCGYRIYNYRVIKNLVLRFGNEPVVEKSFACMMELLYKIYLVDGTFAEVGFQLRYDQKKGDSKMRIANTVVKSLTTAINLRRLN